MRKNKLYILLAVLTSIFLFSTAAMCNQCGVVSEEEKVDVGKEEAAEEEEEGEVTAEEEEAEEEAEEEKEAPTISLAIYEGPSYSPSDGICYYRIQATVTGSPSPSINWSKDDSRGAWGPKKAQVNLYDPGETYTLTATATNSEGSDTDSIEISWGCEEGIEEEEETIYEGWDLGDLLGGKILTFTKVILHPQDIGYIVWPSGVNTETCIFGDSISDSLVKGYFGFSNLGELSEREIDTVTIRLDNPTYWGPPPATNFNGIAIMLDRDDYFPLEINDWDWTPGEFKTFSGNPDPLVWSGDLLKFKIQNCVGSDERADFMIHYTDIWETDLDNQIDGREYTKEDISLIIEFSD